MWLGNVYMTLIIEMNFLWVWGGSPFRKRKKYSRFKGRSEEKCFERKSMALNMAF